MENENEQLGDVKPETSFEVQLYIYDLSRGLAQTLLSQLLGKLMDLNVFIRIKST